MRTSFLRNLQLFLSRFASSFFDKYSDVSYGQTGEDKIIDGIIGVSTSGFYVDVGCNQPIKWSNTYLSYLRGKRGICIDGNGGFANSWKKIRPDDKFVEACVGNGEAVTFEIFERDALSSVGGYRVKSLPEKKYKSVQKKQMVTRPLTNILIENDAPQQFDLLSIDVEGYDEIALFSLDLRVFQPKLIVIEMDDVEISNLESSSIYQHLTKAGYKLVSFHLNNGYFLKIAN